VLTAQLARFTVVDQQEIPALQGLEQLVPKSTNPIIHGVAADQAHAVHLLAHASLQRRLDITEQQIIGMAIAWRYLWREVGEYVQIGPHGGAVIHIVGVDALPKKRFPWNTFQPFEVDMAAGQEIGISLVEVLANHGDDLHVCEVTCR